MWKAEPQLSSLSTLARLMNILEVEDRGMPQPSSLPTTTRLVIILQTEHWWKTAAQLASHHHEANEHP
jgi:hypothetical protein